MPQEKSSKQLIGLQNFQRRRMAQMLLQAYQWSLFCLPNPYTAESEWYAVFLCYNPLFGAMADNLSQVHCPESQPIPPVVITWRKSCQNTFISSLSRVPVWHSSNPTTAYIKVTVCTGIALIARNTKSCFYHNLALGWGEINMYWGKSILLAWF